MAAGPSKNTVRVTDKTEVTTAGPGLDFCAEWRQTGCLAPVTVQPTELIRVNQGHVPPPNECMTSQPPPDVSRLDFRSSFQGEGISSLR